MQDELRKKITDEILKSQDVDGKVRQAYESAKPDLDKALESLEDTVETELEEDPGLWWKDSIKRIARELAAAIIGGTP